MTGTYYSRMTGEEIAHHIERVREAISFEKQQRVQQEIDNRDLKAELALAKKMGRWKHIEWQGRVPAERNSLLEEENPALRALTLKRMCMECGHGMCCIHCAPYPVAGLEIGEASNFGFDGVCVLTVKKGGSADEAGVKVGDIFTSLDCSPVRTKSQFKQMLRRCVPLQPLDFELYREEGVGGWCKMQGRMVLGSGTELPKEQRTLYHPMDTPNARDSSAPLGSSPRALRVKRSATTVAPPPFRTTRPKKGEAGAGSPSGLGPVSV